MAFKVINDSAGLDSLIPTLLVFGAYLYIVESNIPNPTVIKLNWDFYIRAPLELSTALKVL